jgi:hypothetical protein
MSFYRYYYTLGESSNAIVESQRRRALRRQVALEGAVLVLTILVALAVCVRLLSLEALTIPSLDRWAAALQSFL